MTVKGRALAFRLHSRIGSYTEQIIALDNRRSLLQALRIFREPSFAEEINKAVVCQGGFVDPWTAELKRLFPSVALLRSFRCRLILQLTLLLLFIDTSVVECGHASIRRLLHMHGVQTHARTAEDVVADWLIACIRREAAQMTVFSCPIKQHARNLLSRKRIAHRSGIVPKAH